MEILELRDKLVQKRAMQVAANATAKQSLEKIQEILMECNEKDRSILEGLDINTGLLLDSQLENLLTDESFKSNFFAEVDTAILRLKKELEELV